MKEMYCRKAATVGFWDGYAPWYKLWLEHNNYHNRIIEVLTTMVEPGWKVLDIGAGNGILSLPLCAIECGVTALEPSTGMRSLLYEEAFKRGIDWISVDDRRWEDVSCLEMQNYDLIMACNSLHLTKIGFRESVKRIFKAKPRHVFIISELGPEIKVEWRYGDYSMAFTKCYEEESFLSYHSMDEVFEHWSFKKGKALYPDEETKLKAMVSHEDDHLRIKYKNNVGMFWWERLK